MLYIIRHGQTANNKKKLLQGRSDTPLNEEGIRQAKMAADWFADQGIRFTKVYSSPLRRAVETAKVVGGPESTILIDERLIEMDYGPYEGMDLANPHPEIIRFFSDFVNQKAPEGMESLDSVTKRLGLFLEEIVTEAENENVLVSTHAIAEKGALEYLSPESGRTATMVLPSFSSFFANSTAAYRAAPEDIPVLTPSVLVRYLLSSNALSLA